MSATESQASSQVIDINRTIGCGSASSLASTVTVIEINLLFGGQSTLGDAATRILGGVLSAACKGLLASGLKTSFFPSADSKDKRPPVSETSRRAPVPIGAR